jgi:prepilin-type N-terminal cleavage/methylation domain-containing protein
MDQKISQRGQRKGFTLVELLVVLALISILAVILIVALKPQEIFMKARDAQRSGDLRTLDTALQAIYAETIQGTPNLDNQNNSTCLSATTSPRIYYSVGGLTITSLTTISPILGTVATFTLTGTTSRALDGTGWLPVRFVDFPIIALSQLPIDPTNNYSQKLYYTYTCYSGSLGVHYEINARLESPVVTTSPTRNDGGDNDSLLERGSRLDLLPRYTGGGFY